MNLSLQSLRSNKAAIKKYKDREVKIYHGLFCTWFVLGFPSCITRRYAQVYTLSDALVLLQFYHNESKIEFFFMDAFGEDTMSIRDFDVEDVHNCPSVHFDALSKSNKL